VSLIALYLSLISAGAVRDFLTVKIKISHLKVKSSNRALTINHKPVPAQ
jgi:hypothetical protein